MLEKIKKFVDDHRAAVIQKGGMLLGGLIGLVVVAVLQSEDKSDNTPVDWPEDILL